MVCLRPVTMWILFAACVVAVACDSDFENNFAEIAEQNETGLLVNHLRRRLMRDNYDYQSNETAEAPVKRQHNDNGDNNHDGDDLKSDVNPKGGNHDEHVNNLFVPRARDDDLGNTHAISRKDLLYYVDDEQLGSVKRRAGNEVVEDNYTDEVNVTNNTTRNLTYKLRKMPNKFPNRRSLAAYHRFIEERSPTGIALMPLDAGPLPQFRLPRSRRQYMHNHHHHVSEDDFTDISAPDRQ